MSSTICFIVFRFASYSCSSLFTFLSELPKQTKKIVVIFVHNNCHQYFIEFPIICLSLLFSQKNGKNKNYMLPSRKYFSRKRNRLLNLHLLHFCYKKKTANMYEDIYHFINSLWALFLCQGGTPHKIPNCTKTSCCFDFYDIYPVYPCTYKLKT